MNKINYLELIKTADVYSVAEVSPLDYAKLISANLNNKIFLKREDLQTTFSFEVNRVIGVSFTFGMLTAQMEVPKYLLFQRLLLELNKHRNHSLLRTCSVVCLVVRYSCARKDAGQYPTQCPWYGCIPLC